MLNAIDADAYLSPVVSIEVNKPEVSLNYYLLQPMFTNFSLILSGGREGKVIVDFLRALCMYLRHDVNAFFNCVASISLTYAIRLFCIE